MVLHANELRLETLVNRCNEIVPMVVQFARRQLSLRLSEQQQTTQQQQQQQQTQSPLLIHSTTEVPEIDDDDVGAVTVIAGALQPGAPDI